MPSLFRNVNILFIYKKQKKPHSQVRHFLRLGVYKEKCFNSRRYAIQKKIMSLSASFTVAAEECALPALIFSAEGAQLRPAVIAMIAKTTTAMILSARTPAESFFAAEQGASMRDHEVFL